MTDAPPSTDRYDWPAYAAAALVERFDDAVVAGAARTPFADYNGVFAQVSPTDLGIHAARAAIARSGVDAARIGATIAGCCAQASFDAFYLPRHIGLYAGVPADRPALGVHRLCTTGFEALAQAARLTSTGHADAVLAAGAESMSRNPVAAYTHRGGFRMGRVDFADFLWEATLDTAVNRRMGDTAEVLAAHHGITRDATDAYAARSFARAAAARDAGRFAEEIAPVADAVFEAPHLERRTLRLPRGAGTVDADGHIRPTDAATLARLPAAFGGVQTGGNSSAIVDGAAAAVVVRGALAGAGGTQPGGRGPLGRIVMAATAAVPPEAMGIGPVPAALALLRAAGLGVADIDLWEINEAFGAQAEAVRRALDAPEDRWNVNGGAIAFGHPLAATGVRCVLSALLELRRRGGRRAIAGACAGGGQGMALLLEAA